MNQMGVNLELEEGEWHYMSSGPDKGMTVHIWVNSDKEITHVEVHDLDSLLENIVVINSKQIPHTDSKVASAGEMGYSIKGEHASYDPTERQFVKTFVTPVESTERITEIEMRREV